MTVSVNLENLKIKPFDLRNASEHEYAAMNIFANRLRAEHMPVGATGSPRSGKIVPTRDVFVKRMGRPAAWEMD